MTSTYGERLQLLIDHTYASQEAEDGMRKHLGASVIGDPCMRALWYGFRWAASEQWEGRMLRLVHFGQREEAVFVDLFRRLGVEVWTHDENGNQFRISEFGGHFGGSTDGVARNLPELGDLPVALELKTHNLRNFTLLVDKGVRTSHPQHYKQAQVYMHGFKLTKCLYVALCKNDHKLHIELLDYDHTVAVHMLAKAETIVFGSGIPARIGSTPAWYECKFCECKEICFGFQKPDRTNCRTCTHSKPLREGGWACRKGRGEILTDPKSGCEEHEFMEELK